MLVHRFGFVCIAAALFGAAFAIVVNNSKSDRGSSWRSAFSSCLYPAQPGCQAEAIRTVLDQGASPRRLGTVPTSPVEVEGGQAR